MHKKHNLQGNMLKETDNGHTQVASASEQAPNESCSIFGILHPTSGDFFKI